MPRRITPIKARQVFKRRLLLGLVMRPVRLFCDHCDKYVPSDMKWRCGFCNDENGFTKFYSFLNKCRTCKRAPKSFKCPHCGTVNFLDKDREVSHPASKVDAYAHVQTNEELRALKLQQRADQKEDLKHEILVTRLNAELATLKASVEFDTEKKAMTLLEKRFSAHDAHMMGVHKIAARERAANAEKFKDQPDLLDMANQSIDSWVAKEI